MKTKVKEGLTGLIVKLSFWTQIAFMIIFAGLVYRVFQLDEEFIFLLFLIGGAFNPVSMLIFYFFGINFLKLFAVAMFFVAISLVFTNFWG